MRARTNRSADSPFEHGIHHEDREREEWGRHAQHLERSADYGHPIQQQQQQSRPYGGFTGDRERFGADEREQYRGDPDRQDYWRHEAEQERFRRGMHGMQSTQGMQGMYGYPHDEGQRGSHEMRGYNPPPTTYGNVPYDQMRNRPPSHEVWRGRDENYDFWGQERHPHGEHPSLWQRVKGVFSGKGPKNYVRSDERIREDVCEHLSYHPYVDASDIEVIVRDGEVTLTGTVEARMVKRAAEECADHVRGVKDIHNHLRVRPSQTT
jgi:hypothetical protein